MIRAWFRVLVLLVPGLTWVVGAARVIAREIVAARAGNWQCRLWPWLRWCPLCYLDRRHK